MRCTRFTILHSTLLMNDPSSELREIHRKIVSGKKEENKKTQQWCSMRLNLLLKRMTEAMKMQHHQRQYTTSVVMKDER